MSGALISRRLVQRLVNFFSSIAFDWSRLISLIQIEVIHKILRILVVHLRGPLNLVALPLSDLFAHKDLLETRSTAIDFGSKLLGCVIYSFLFLKGQK